MKKEVTNKSKKWILPVIIGAALLVVAGILLAIFLRPQGPTGGPEETVQSKLYWNVDREAMLDPELGLSNREKGEDGLYAIRFAVDGEHVELKCADKRIVNGIDMLDLMGLTFDADGLIVGILQPTEVATELAYEFFVKEVTDTAIIVNSSMGMNGMDQELPLTENTGIYNVDAMAEIVGQKDTCQLMDKVTAYGNADGEVTHIYIIERSPEAGVYIRQDAMYDNLKGTTTREPDANGVYTIPFAYEGELVELKCKDKAIVSKIDAESLNQMGLLFDEEGYISEIVNVAIALRGKLVATRYHVTAVEGDIVTLESIWSYNKDIGTVLTVQMREDCDIFIDETGCGAHFDGERVDGLQVNDMVYMYTDLEDQAIFVLIQRRMVDTPLYYNMSRSWNGEGTKRQPDENGWYVSQMVGINGYVELRTKDKSVADRVDKYYCLGMELKGDIILDVYDPACVTGASSAGIGYYVSEISGPVVRIVSNSDFESGTNYLSDPSCLIFDVSDRYSTKIGTKTTLRVGDKITAYKNPSNQLTYVYVTSRYIEGAKIYYNINRQYDSTLKETKRVADEEGYYVFDMICEGKTVQVKTKDKALATYIDAMSSCCPSLLVSNGIIKDAAVPEASIKYGINALNSYYIDNINDDGTLDIYYGSADNRTYRTITYTLSDKTKIYNVGDGYLQYKGETTKLQKDDYVIGYAAVDAGELSVVFVKGRKMESKLYWQVSQQYNSTTGETTREPDADGYYVFDLLVDGKIQQFKTKDKAVASKVDSYSNALGLRLDGDIILQAYGPESIKGLSGVLSSFYDVMTMNGSKLHLVRNQVNSSQRGKETDIELAANYKVYDVSPSAKVYGEPGTIGIGDRLYCLGDSDGKASVIYILYKSTRKAGATGYCEHCGKEVWWEPYNNMYAVQDAHYYLTADMTKSERSVGYTAAALEADSTKTQYEAVLDLNGFTLTSENRRNFSLYSTLSIMDSAGGGKLVCVGDDRNGGNILMYAGSTLNLYGGTIAGGSPDLLMSRGGAVSATDATINLYGGTIAGGEAQRGSNIYLNNSTLNVAGGTVDGGIYADNNSTVVLNGKVNIPKGSYDGVRLLNGSLIDVTKMTTGSTICVAADGVFTTERNDITTVLDCFTTQNSYDSIAPEGNALSYTQGEIPVEEILSGMKTWLETYSAAFAAGTGLPNSCPCCVGAVSWIAITGEEGAQITSTENGPKTHFYLANDMTISGDYRFLRSSIDACLYLNGKSLEYAGNGDGVFHGAAANLNIFGDGSVTNNGTSNLFAYNGAGSIKVYGGSYIQNGAAAMFKDVMVVAENTVGTHALLYGGTFNVNPATQSFGYTNVVTVAEGYGIQNNGDGTWTVAEGITTEPDTPDTPEQPELPTNCDCGAQNVTWTILNNSAATVQLAATEGAHYYLTGDYISSTEYGVIRAAGNDFCVNLNGYTLGNSGTGFILRMGSNTVNIYGEGNVVNNANSDSYMFDFSQNGTLNIYGGTYTNLSTTKGMFEGQTQTYVNIYGGTFNMDPATYADNGVDNVTVVEGYGVTDNGDGTWTVTEQAPAGPELPTQCPGCGETLTAADWTALTEDIGDRIYSDSSFYGIHLYLANDITYGDRATEFLRVYTANNCCLYLNGMTLTNNGTGNVFQTRAYELNIFGEGTVINNSNANMFDFNGTGRVNILGGTYVQNGTAGMFEDLVVTGEQTTHALISGGTFNVDPSALTFTNANVLTIAEGLAANDNGDGTWTIGTPAPVGPQLPTTCPACQAQNVEWHAITGEEGKQVYPGDAEFPGTHYYLSKEISIDGTYRFLRAYSGVDCCLYLNGQTLNYQGSNVVFHAGSQTINICGEGTVNYSGSGKMFDYNGAGRINIYGGTYNQTGTGAVFEDKVLVDGQTTHVMLYGGTFGFNPAELTFTNANVVTFAEGYGAADNGDGTWVVTSKTRICPGCNKIVEPDAWETYTDQNNSADKALTVTDGHKHYKLAENHDFGAAGYMLYITDGSACFDLAGCEVARKGSTGAGQSPFYNHAGSLNIIDSVGGATVYNGVATGTAVITGSGTVTLGSGAAIVNLKGGTFKTTGNTIPIINLEKGGTVNMYEGASVISTASSNRHGVGVRAIGNADNKATFIMHGGILSIAESTNTSGANYTGAAISTGRPVATDAASNADIQILGGVVTGTSVANPVGDCIFIKQGTSLTIGGNAVINGEVYLQNENASITLKGAPTINAGGSDNAGLVLNGALANIDELEAEAQIQITGAAGDVLTAASENAATVEGSFAVTTDGLTVKNENNQLVIAENLMQAVVMSLRNLFSALF